MLSTRFSSSTWDGFKAVNDEKGHHAGDRLLARLPPPCASLCTDDAVGRFGGDEFLVLARAWTGRRAETLAEYIRTSVEAVARPPANKVAPALATRRAPPILATRCNCCITPTKPCTSPSALGKAGNTLGPTGRTGPAARSLSNSAPHASQSSRSRHWGAMRPEDARSNKPNGRPTRRPEVSGTGDRLICYPYMLASPPRRPMSPHLFH
ncbi:MAG: GGDEF domain-containing protein [Betaproteobacteria bacterium]|nr:GGDEF domain-containing protein [Betaproteobacteria bacterium]